MTSNLLRRIETFVIVVIIAVIGIAYAFMQNPVPTKNTPEQNAQNEQSGQEQKVEEISGMVQYSGEEGKSAIELLKASNSVETDEYPGVGEYVVAINGTKADSTTNFWSFYVNDKPSSVGASQYITKNGDMIEWKLESISQ
jgi:hypothetical protein